MACRRVDPFRKSISGPHVQPCVEGSALVWAGLLWLWTVGPASAPSLAVGFEGQALCLIAPPRRTWGGVRLAPHPQQSCFDACRSPRDVTWYKVVQKWPKRQTDGVSISSLRFRVRPLCRQTKARGTGATSPISWNLWQTIPSPSRTLKTLVSCFFFFTCGECTFGTVYNINQKCVVLTVTWYNTAVLS